MLATQVFWTEYSCIWEQFLVFSFPSCTIFLKTACGKAFKNNRDFFSLDSHLNSQEECCHYSNIIYTILIHISELLLKSQGKVVLEGKVYYNQM